MKKGTFQNYLFIVLLSLPFCGYSQFGVTGFYQLNDAGDGWRLFDSNNNTEDALINNGYGFGIDYWFRLKNQRIEFTPELSYSRYNTQALSGAYEYNVSFFSFQFNTNIYLLDLLSDCNCPTFSKQNDFFKKGFFIRIAPGLTIPHFDLVSSPTSTESVGQMGSLSPTIALGAGLDIGITDLVTITPLVTAKFVSQAEWEGAVPQINTTPADPGPTTVIVQNPKTNLWQINPGIRVGIRLDNW